MQAGRDPAPVARLLNEMTAGSVSSSAATSTARTPLLPASGHGPLRVSVVDCWDLQIRGMARCWTGTGRPLRALVGDGRLLLTLGHPRAPLPTRVSCRSRRASARVFEAPPPCGRAAAGTGSSGRETGAAAADSSCRSCRRRRARPDGWNHRGNAGIAATVKDEQTARPPSGSPARAPVPGRGRSGSTNRTVAYHCPQDWREVRRHAAATGAGRPSRFSPGGQILIRARYLPTTTARSARRRRRRAVWRPETPLPVLTETRSAGFACAMMKAMDQGQSAVELGGTAMPVR